MFEDRRYCVSSGAHVSPVKLTAYNTTSELYARMYEQNRKQRNFRIFSEMEGNGLRESDNYLPNSG